MKKINLDLFDNIFYQIKGSKSQQTKEISIFFKICAYGFFPHKQYMKINIVHESSNR